MAVINLRNVVALGVLDDGVYPSVYNGQTGEYIGTVDGEGKGVKTVPTLYMYYRKNGHLYLYRTKERIEIDLTNVTAYDNSALFKLTEKTDVSNARITEFESRTIDVDCYKYKVSWVKPTQEFLYILVPIVRSIHTITIQGIIANPLFTLEGIYVHDGKSWWIYRTCVKTRFNFSDPTNESLDVQVYVRSLIAEDLAPVEQLTLLLEEHINNKFNPHEVTKEQVGLGNVDNTADKDKPVSGPQKEYIDALEKRVQNWFSQLNTWLNQYVKDLAKQLQDLWDGLNKKLDKQEYLDDKTGFSKHIKDFNNPHHVTAEQVGLGNVTGDISSLRERIQELEGELVNKQDKQSDELETESKRIVDAINEILHIVEEHNNHVSSNSIKQIEVVTDIPTKFEDGILYIRIPRNEEDYITVRIIATPDDAIIHMVNSENKTYEGRGTASLECLVQSRLHYIVKKTGYTTRDVWVELGVEDQTITVALEETPVKHLTVNSLTEGAKIEILTEDGITVLVNALDSVIYETVDIRNVKIRVSKDGYKTYEEDILIDQDITRNIILEPVQNVSVNITVVADEDDHRLQANVYRNYNNQLIGTAQTDSPLVLTDDYGITLDIYAEAKGYRKSSTTTIHFGTDSDVEIRLTKKADGHAACTVWKQASRYEGIKDCKFRYHTGDNQWKDIEALPGTGCSKYVTLPADTVVTFEASKEGYVTNSNYGTVPDGGNIDVKVYLTEAPPEPKDKTITVKAYEMYNDEKIYVAANIKSESEQGEMLGVSNPDEWLKVIKQEHTVMELYAIPIVEGYTAGHANVTFDDDKDVEIEVHRINNGLIKVRLRDAKVKAMLAGNINDTSDSLVGTCTLAEDGYVSDPHPVGESKQYKVSLDGYEDWEPASKEFTASKPKDAEVQYIDLTPKDSASGGSDYIALKFVDSQDKHVITSGITGSLDGSPVEINCDYQGIAIIKGTYEISVKAQFSCIGYHDYNNTIDKVENFELIQIEMIPTSVQQNVTVTIKAYTGEKEYLTAKIESNESGDFKQVGTTTPDIPLVITKSKGTEVTYRAVPDKILIDGSPTNYKIYNNSSDTSVTFDNRKTVELECTFKEFENDGISYMEIEGNGVDKPKFRIK